MLAGSLHYMAPEQLLGAPASVASDIYAFAVIAYELLTGAVRSTRTPRATIAAIPLLMTLQRSGQVVPPQQLRPSVSAGGAGHRAARAGVRSDGAPGRCEAVRRRPGAGAARRRRADPDGRDATRERPVAAHDMRACACAAPTGWRSYAACAGRGAAVARRAAPVPQPPARRRGWLVAAAVAVALGAVLGLVHVARTWRSPDGSPALQQEATPGPSRLAERT